MPTSCKLGKTKGASTVNDGVRTLKFDDLRLMGDNGVKSVLFQEGGVIDFTHVTKARVDCQFRNENKFWLVKGISFNFSQKGRGQITISCAIDLMQVIRSTKLVQRKEEWVEEAFKHFISLGVPEKEIRSKETCFLLIAQPISLSFDSLVYDWSRIYDVICYDKVSKVLVHKQTQQ